MTTFCVVLLTQWMTFISIFLVQFTFAIEFAQNLVEKKENFSWKIFQTKQTSFSFILFRICMKEVSESNWIEYYRRYKRIKSETNAQKDMKAIDIIIRNFSAHFNFVWIWFPFLYHFKTERFDICFLLIFLSIFFFATFLIVFFDDIFCLFEVT